MSGTNIRVIDLPDLGAVTDASSFVIDKNTTTGRFTGLALKNYCAVATLPDAPSTNTPYGRMNGAWSPVLGDAPSNSLPYARFNAAWYPVVPEAPLTGSTYGRVSAGWTPVLPITGGTISGNLGTTGNMTVSGNVYGSVFSLSSANSYEWSLYVQAGTGNHIQAHRAGWYDAFISATGERDWYGPGGLQMSLNSSSQLAVMDSITGAAIWQTVNAFGFAPGGQGRKFFFSPTYYWEWNSTTGQQTWISNGTPMWNMRASDGLTFNSVAPVGGVGPYLNTSDRRTKAGVTPSTKGLAEVLQLQPVSFTRDYPGVPAGAPEEIGFIAQDVQPIVPEAVWGAAIVTLADGTGGLDTGDPMLAISESTLTALNVNAIKELNGLITALTARVATLEGP